MCPIIVYSRKGWWRRGEALASRWDGLADSDAPPGVETGTPLPGDSQATASKCVAVQYSRVVYATRNPSIIAIAFADRHIHRKSFALHIKRSSSVLAETRSAHALMMNRCLCCLRPEYMVRVCTCATPSDHSIAIKLQKTPTPGCEMAYRRALIQERRVLARRARAELKLLINAPGGR